MLTESKPKQCCVIDAPGSKPYQKYARRRDRQIYNLKNKVLGVKLVADFEGGT